MISLADAGEGPGGGESTKLHRRKESLFPSLIKLKEIYIFPANENSFSSTAGKKRGG